MTILHPTIVRTQSGRGVDLANLKPSDIDIRDIAHHLALINRFNGATPTPYSVAQHSVLVADILEDKRLSPATQMRGLLHDAHEYLLGDVTTPVMEACGCGLALGITKAAFDCIIFEVFGCGANLAQSQIVEVNIADMEALATEWRDLMRGACPSVAKPSARRVTPVHWHAAEEKFFTRYTRLCEQMGRMA